MVGRCLKSKKTAARDRNNPDHSAPTYPMPPKIRANVYAHTNIVAVRVCNEIEEILSR